MEIVITEWALNSYLELRHKQTFSAQDYRERIRPDVVLLKDYPDEPKFQNDKFWSPAVDQSHHPIRGGFKMKWHQIGSGRVQLRLPVGMFDEAFLCEAYVKGNKKEERRMLARFKTHVALIGRGRHTERGRLK
jgi:hypothetical protein